MLNPRRVLTRAQLLEHVWDYDFGGDARVLETYVRYLRKKLDAHGPPLIHTVRGVGYALRHAAHVMASLRARLVAGAARARRRRAAAARRRSPTPSSARSCSTASTSRRAPRAGAVERRAGRARHRRPRPRPTAAAAAGGPPRGGGPGVGLPAGTYGERRDADGHGARRRGRLRLRAERDRRARDLPAELPVGTIRTVDGARATTALPRRSPTRDRAAAGTIVVAVPLREVDQTLDRLLLVEALVIAGVLLAARGASRGSSCASACARWTASAHTAGAIAGGDLSHRVEADRRAHRGRPARARAQRDARPARAARSPSAQASEDRLRRFLADASHELRTPLASIRGYAELFRIGAAREPERASRRRCAGSRTRRRAWACSSRTC